jgi:hypothetical protein
VKVNVIVPEIDEALEFARPDPLPAIEQFGNRETPPAAIVSVSNTVDPGDPVEVKVPFPVMSAEVVVMVAGPVVVLPNWVAVHRTWLG